MKSRTSDVLPDDDDEKSRPPKRTNSKERELEEFEDPDYAPTPEQMLRFKELPNEHRDRVMALYKPLWIGYDEAKEIRKIIERSMEIPYSGRVTSCTIVGPSMNGKTAILKSVVRRHNPKPDEAGDTTAPARNVAPSLPVLFMQSPPAPDEKRFLTALLRHLRVMGPQKEAEELMIDRIKAVFHGLGVKLLAIDEFGFFGAGTAAKQRKALNALKYLSNELETPFALAAVESGLNVLSSHDEIQNRFPAKMLPPWTKDRSSTADMLESFELKLGLKERSGLGEEAMVEGIVTNANYVLGHIHDLLRRLAEKAILSGAERITEADLKAPALKAMGWVHPTMRSMRSQ